MKSIRKTYWNKTGAHAVHISGEFFGQEFNEWICTVDSDRWLGASLGERYKEMYHYHNVVAVDLSVHQASDFDPGGSWPCARIELYDSGLVFVAPDIIECEKFWERYSVNMGLHAHMKRKKK